MFLSVFHVLMVSFEKNGSCELQYAHHDAIYEINKKRSSHQEFVP